MQESLYETVDAGVCFTNSECRSLNIRQGAIVPLYNPAVHNHACRTLYYKQRVQELLYQKAGYGVSLTENYNRQRGHAAIRQKVLSEGVQLNFDNAYFRIFYGEKAGSKYRKIRIQIPLKVGHHRPVSETPFKCVCWRADDGPTLNAGLVAL